MLTAEQILARQGRCGGSDVAAILGLSPWRTPFDVWAEKSGLMPRSQEENPAQKRGRLMEQMVADWYAEETGWKVYAPVVQTVTGADDWMVGSYDRLVHAPHGIFGLELKTAKRDDGWGPDGAVATGLEAATILPPYYATQVLWYLEVSGFDRWDVAVFFTFGDEFRRHTVFRDVEQGAVLVARVREWWDRHIVGGERPDLDGSDAAQAWVRSAFPEVRGELRMATGEESEIALQLREAEAWAKKAEDAVAELKVRLCESIGHAEGIRGSFGKVTWSVQKGARRLDTERLKTEQPSIVEQYTKQAPDSRVLRKQWTKE